MSLLVFNDDFYAKTGKIISSVENIILSCEFCANDNGKNISLIESKL